MRKIIYFTVILEVLFVVTVSGRSIDEVLGTMDKQIHYYKKQLSSQIPDLSEPFHNWFVPTSEAQKQNIAILNQQAQVAQNSDSQALDQPQSYQTGNTPPSWMTQNQNHNIPSWMLDWNIPQNPRTTTQRPAWNQQPTQRPNVPQNNQQPQNPAPGPVQQQFTNPPVQNTQQPIINHQTQAPVVLNTVPSWMVPTNPPNLGGQQNLNQPNVNQPNWNGQVNQNQQIPATQSPNIGNNQQPSWNQQTKAPNLIVTPPVNQNTQPPLLNLQTQPVQVTNPTQPQFTAPVIQSTTSSNLVQQTQAPNLHMTAPVIQNTQSTTVLPTQAPQINQNTQAPWILDQNRAEDQNSIPSWVVPTQQPIPTSHPIFTAPVISRTQPQQIQTSTQSPWMPVVEIQPNFQFPTAPSVTNSPRFPTAPSITMLPQFPSLNLVDSQQPWLNHIQNNQNVQNVIENQQQLQHVTNSQGVTFPAFTAPVIRKTQPPLNMRQNQLPNQDFQITIPIVTRATTTTFPRVPIITTARPGFPTAGVVTTRPPFPTVGVFTTTTRPSATTTRPMFPNIPTTTTRNPLFPIIPQTTTKQPQVTFFPPIVTTRSPNVPQTTPRFPLIPNIPQTTTRPTVATTRFTVPTIRPPVTTPRSPQAITRPPVITGRPTTTERPQKQTTKEISRTTQPEIRQPPPRNQQSINDIMKMTDNMLSSLTDQIWQSISRVG